MPMTLVNREYFHEIITTLRNEGLAIQHFALTASKETVYRRLRKRGDDPNSWNYKQVAKCVEALNDPLFERQIHTEEKSIEAVAEEIGEIVGIPLHKRKTKLAQIAYRIWVQLKHIR
ncbi:hypothetical protein ACI7RC_20750 [Brevibacillus sp. B_LB10_24]|uniref:hypothetical protein n=1 Tax=Brevibacillus sp. B_LB10_24 TaxID=3380645 RepID=UPI0038B9A6E8